MSWWHHADDDSDLDRSEPWQTRPETFVEYDQITRTSFETVRWKDGTVQVEAFTEVAGWLFPLDEMRLGN